MRGPTEDNFGDYGYIQYLDCVDGFRVHMYIIPYIAHFKCMQFVACWLYFSKAIKKSQSLFRISS